jgi:hypothetical protein
MRFWLALLAPTLVFGQLSIDFSEAEQAVRILHQHGAVTTEDWAGLFATAPYQDLKAREAAMGRPFTDDAFRQFLLSPEAAAKVAEWEAALRRVKQADFAAIGARMLEWLPAGARIRARVYPEIKPRTNSFVWTKPGGEPAIFLYLESQTTSQFENTVAHERHHIGLASLAVRTQRSRTVEWMSAFGEGQAMLAAAGSADRHPHSEDDALTRARWDGDLMSFHTDLQALEQFLMEMLDGRFDGKSDDLVMERAAPFWGDAQGAWYTVGYEMSALIERRYGRAALLECMLDPRRLLERYNEIALEANAKRGAKLATWSPALLARLRRF